MRRPITTRPKGRALVASGAGLGVIVGCVLGAAPAFAADGFTDEQKNAVYSSDVTTATGSASAPDPASWSIQMMDVFDGLRTDRDPAAGDQATMAFNDALTSEINLGADDAQRQRAIVDQYGDMSLTMADGLGEELGSIYADAMAAGELPKTQWLLTKSGGRIGYYASTNPAKNFFDYDRPYLRLDTSTQLRYVDREGGDAWGSTSGSFPSGHTSQAYWQGTALATMLPELAPQILARTAEAGHNRIVIAAHYPLDVISGRMMGQKIVQLRWADPDFRALLEDASTELRTVLESGCGDSLETCIARDTPYLPTTEALAYSAERLGYGFPATGPVDVPVSVPVGAESLLISSHPDLTDAQRREVLALTAEASGNPLDVGEQESWQRLNLAAAMAAEVTVGADGSVSIGGDTTPDPEPTPDPETTPAPGVTPNPGTTLPSTGEGATPPTTTDGDDRPASARGALAATGADGAGLGAQGLFAGLLVAAGAALVISRRFSRR